MNERGGERLFPAGERYGVVTGRAKEPAGGEGRSRGVMPRSLCRRERVCARLWDPAGRTIAAARNFKRARPCAPEARAQPLLIRGRGSIAPRFLGGCALWLSGPAAGCPLIMSDLNNCSLRSGRARGVMLPPGPARFQVGLGRCCRPLARRADGISAVRARSTRPQPDVCAAAYSETINHDANAEKYLA